MAGSARGRRPQLPRSAGGARRRASSTRGSGAEPASDRGRRRAGADPGRRGGDAAAAADLDDAQAGGAARRTARSSPTCSSGCAATASTRRSCPAASWPTGSASVLGDGSELGVRLRYVEEPRPLGTGGALKFAEELLQERFFMLNGDVLTDIDLTAQLRQHERTGARATLALVPVEDPSAYGLVRLWRRHGSVSEFVEKPRPEEIDTNLINAGAYIARARRARDMAAGRDPASRSSATCSPRSSSAGCSATRRAATGWTSARRSATCRRTFDILEGDVSTEVGAPAATRRAGPCARATRGGWPGPCTRRRWSGAGCVVAAGAILGGRTVLGPRRDRRSRRPHRELGAARRLPGRRGHADQLGDRRARGVDRRALPGRGRRRARPGRDRRARTTCSRPACVSSPGCNCPPERSRFECPAELTRAAMAAGDPTGQLDDVLGLPRAPARRAVARGVGQPGAARRAGRARDRRDGWLGDRRRRWPAPRSATGPRVRS